MLDIPAILVDTWSLGESPLYHWPQPSSVSNLTSEIISLHIRILGGFGGFFLKEVKSDLEGKKLSVRFSSFLSEELAIGSRMGQERPMRATGDTCCLSEFKAGRPH